MNPLFETIGNIFSTFKILSGIVSGVSLIGVIWYVFATDSLGGYRRYRRDIRTYGNEEKKRIPERWKHVLKLIQSHKPQDWTEALKGADELLDDVLRMAGYNQATAQERLAELDAIQIPNADALRKARGIARGIMDEEGFFDQKQAKEILREYRSVFQQLGYL